MCTDWHCGFEIFLVSCPNCFITTWRRLKLSLILSENLHHVGCHFCSGPAVGAKVYSYYLVAGSWFVTIGLKWRCDGGCVAGSRSPGGRRGPARHHDGQPARSGHARATLRAHHEEIFQFWYAGNKWEVSLSKYLEAITFVNDHAMKLTSWTLFCVLLECCV